MDGILNICKPSGMSSFACLKAVKFRLLRELSDNASPMRAKSVKMGFLGTLDPNADGVLVLLCGRYTKMADKLHEGDKTYHTLLQTFFRQSKAGIAVAVEEKVRYHIL